MSTRFKHDCPGCTCGLTQVAWSDREVWIDLTNHESVADCLVNVAQDHSYDIHQPSGISDALWAIVEEHLTRVRPDWREHTVTMNDVQQRRLKTALLKALGATT